MYVLLVGTIVDGIKVVGPFPNAFIATDYADQHERSQPWQLSQISDTEIVENFLVESGMADD